MLCIGRHTLSNIYLSEQLETRYWSLVKFLNRGKWDEDVVGFSPSSVYRLRKGEVFLRRRQGDASRHSSANAAARAHTSFQNRRMA